MSKLVLFGTCSIARLAHFYSTHDSEHEVVAFAMDGEYRQAGGAVTIGDTVEGVYEQPQAVLLDKRSHEVDR
ncbi:MAG: hypothetical protein ACJ76J_24225 [Thermoanaerobaculia bacterium]